MKGLLCRRRPRSKPELPQRRPVRRPADRGRPARPRCRTAPQGVRESPRPRSLSRFLQRRKRFRSSLSFELILKRAGLSLELAQARYDRGLCALAELNQAQLLKGTAELQQASARYDYAAQTAALSFQLGSDFN